MIDEYDDDREKLFTITNNIEECAAEEQLQLMIENGTEEIRQVLPDDGHPVIIQDHGDEQDIPIDVNEDKGMIISPKDNIMSEEESILENNTDISEDNEEENRSVHREKICLSGAVLL